MIKHREHREPICPDGIIQGEPMLESVIRPDPSNAHIFFSHEELVDHCNLTCKKTSECQHEQEKAKREILNIFKNYDKPIVDPVIAIESGA